MTLGDQVCEAIAAHLDKIGQKSLGCLNRHDIKAIVDGAGIGRAKKPGGRQTPDADWLAELKADPAFTGIDIDAQLAKAQFWCGQNGRTCTRRFFTNWLLKAQADKPLSIPSGAPAHAEIRSASLGALQMQLKRIESDLDDIFYPGGCAYKRNPTGEKLERANQLLAQRTELKRRLGDYSSPRQETRGCDNPEDWKEAI